MLKLWCKYSFHLRLTYSHRLNHRLKDLAARKETNKLVAELVELDRVRSVLRAIPYRRQFLGYLEKKKAEKYEKGMLFLFF